MSANLIIGIVAAIAVVGGGVYVATNPEVMSSITGSFNMGTSTPETTNENASVGSTFAQLLALGQSVQCTFSHNDGKGNISAGTVYMTSGGTQIRGDFTVTSPVAGEVHMIRTSGYTYLWGPMMPQGIKTKVTNETELTQGDNGGIDEDTEFACQAWGVDNSKFTLPAGVTFMDMSASMNIDAQVTVPTGAAGVSGSASVKAQQCASCNMIPDAAAKAQCLAALSC